MSSASGFHMLGMSVQINCHHKDMHHCLLQPGIRIRPLFFKGFLRDLFKKQEVLCITVIHTPSTQLSVPKAPLTNIPVFHMEIWST